MRLTRDRRTKADKYYEQTYALFEDYVRSRLHCEYMKSRNEPAGEGWGRLEAEARAVVRVCIHGPEEATGLNPEQTAVLKTEVDGVRVAEAIRMATQHRDICRNAAEWGPEAAQSMEWLRNVRRVIAGERHAATREAALLQTPAVDDAEGTKVFWSNNLVQGVLVLAATSAVLPFLGLWYITGFIGFFLLRDNPITVHMTLLDVTTAGAIGALSGLLSISLYGMTRLLKRTEWSERRYEYIWSRFPDRMEAALVTMGYLALAIPSMIDRDTGWGFKLICVFIGASAFFWTVAWRRFASYVFRRDRGIGTAMSIMVLMVAGASHAGALRRDRQENTEYSYTFTTRAAVYETCEYTRLQPVPRITVLRARHARHTIILKAEDITETIRMDSNTVTCSTAR